MSDKLKNLSGTQKKAVVGLACVIEAQGNNGHFRSNDPEMEIVVKECFDDDWVGTWDNDYRHTYLGTAAAYAANYQDECFKIVSELDMETKFAFKNMIIDIIGDNVMMYLAAAFVFKQIGLPSFTPPKEEGKAVERHPEEDDGTAVIEDPFYLLADVGAIRGENDKIFSLVDENKSEEISVGANYDYWLSRGVCPVNGLVGYVDPKKCETTPEGKLCYLVCPGEMVIPVLKWGLEKISEWSYREKSQNNRMLSCDKSGKLCRELREMKKPSAPTKPHKVEESHQDETVLRFDATVQQRIEAGKAFPANYINRSIRLTYTKHGSELRLEVLGVMQPRSARFKNDDGKILTYIDTTRPYTYYEIETEPKHNTIVRVSIFQKNNFFQDIEYRYTR